MPFQEQTSTELKHLCLLRKALTDKHSLTIDFDGREWNGQLKLVDGMVESSEEAILCLSNIFSQPVFRFSWQPSPAPLSPPLDPKMAFYRALTGLHLDENRLKNYQAVFSKLPPVHVKAGTLFRLSVEDMKHYKILYHKGLDEQGVRISEYLDVHDHTFLLRRIRIVLTCYCLGQLIPVDQIRRNSKLGMAGRILARLRRQA